MKKINTLSLLLFFMLFSSTTVWAAETSTTTTSSDEVSETSDSLTTSELPAATSTSEASSEPLQSTSSTEAATESSSSQTETTESTETEVASLQRAAATIQNGTTTYPYLVASQAELTTALAQATPSSSAEGNVTGSDPLTIKLTSDIVYTTTFTTTKNVVLDGGDYSILYNGTAYGSTHFQTSTSGVNVTLKNLNYGNTSYPNSTYYGIFSILATNVTLNIENVNYNITNGAQPFFSNSSGATVNFSGTNTFNQDANGTGSNGGEFIEGIQTINFKAGSSTTVLNRTSGTYADFYETTGVMTINLEKDAIFDLTSGKNDVFFNYSGNTFNLAENAQMKIKKAYAPRDNSSSSFRFNTTQSRTTNINAATNASVEISATTKAFYAGNVPINATDVKSIKFAKASDSTFSGQALAGGTVTFNNSGNNLYQILSETNGVADSSPLVSTIAAGSSSALASSGTPSYAGKSSITYQPAMTISGVSATASVGNKKSQVQSEIEGFTSNLSGWTYQTEYLLSTTRYYDSTSQSLKQTSLTTDFTSSTKPSGVMTFSGTSNSDAGIFNDLLAQDYYIYGRVTATNGSATASTPWQENTVTVPQYIATLFSSSLAFTSPGSEVLSNEASYQIASQSNTPTVISLTDVTTGEDSDSSIQLVDSIPSGSENLLSLGLVAKTASNTTSWKLLSSGSSNSLTLQPYFATEGAASLTLTGTYSGHYNFIKDVNYLLNFKIQASS